MYHALLTNRYLTSRVIPLIAVAAVALCVALVIIVVSVMTGFLNMVKSSGRTLMGDVVVAYPISGIPHYQRLIERIEALPEAEAATPVVDTWGLLRMPYPPGDEKEIQFVQIWGIEPESFSEVTGFENTLQWRALTPEQRSVLLHDALVARWEDVLAGLAEAQRFELVKRMWNLRNINPESIPGDDEIRAQVQRAQPEQWRELMIILLDEGIFEQVLTPEQWQSLISADPRLMDDDRLRRDGLTLTRNGQPAMALGVHVSNYNQRLSDGSYDPAFGYWMPRFDVTLTTIPVVAKGPLDPESVVLPIANEFASGVYLIDDTRAMAPLETVQRLMHLNQADRVDDDLNVVGVDPARATMVLVRAAELITPETLREAVRRAYAEFEREMAFDIVPPPPPLHVGIKTWVEQQQQFIGPIEKEREMMRTLFSLVYIVCAGLVLAIFWAIVYEKTRDIGILRSVGASRIGISWIFLRYGLVVGVLGAIAGVGLAYLVVSNINSIHHALSSPPKEVPITVLALALASLIVTVFKAFSHRLLPVVLGSLITIALLSAGLMSLWLWLIGGVLVWDPAVYYFTRIPNDVDVGSAIITMIGAVIFSLIGAFVPAAKAADTDPVRALRYE